MDDDAADIALLEQHLNKTSHISQRMTTILSQFDNRLGKLEKSILPLHKSTQALTRLAENIESTLQSIDRIASNQEGVAAEEALILRGPRPNDLIAYIDALDRLNASLAFKQSSPERPQRETAKLIEQGAKKLTQFYTKLIAEASSGTPPSSNSSQIDPPPFPSSVLDTLEPVLAGLRGLPLPATHPSHPAAPGIFQALKDAQKGYGDMRGTWARKCLEGVGVRRVVERIETMDGIKGGKEMGRWVAGLLAVADSEYKLLETLAPMPDPVLLRPTYSTVLTPLLSTFTTTMATLVTLLKRSLQKHLVLLLSTYSALQAHQRKWDDVIRDRSGRKDSELKDTLTQLRGLCLRSFPEFLMDVKAEGAKPGAESGTGVAGVTAMVVSYLDQLPSVRDATCEALLQLGDGNWKMGDGAPKVGKVGEDRDLEGDEQLLLEHFVYDIITTLLASLTALARSHRRPALGSIFLLNNVSHLLNMFLNPDAPIAEVLSKPTKNGLNSAFRTAKAGYFDANFSPMIQALGDGVGGKSKDPKKADLKDKYARFYDALEEAEQRHRSARVLPEDEDGREMLEDEVVRLVVPALKRFIERGAGAGGKEGFGVARLGDWRGGGGDASKYIRASPEDVERQIRSFYR